MPERPPEKRIRDFAEVPLGFTPEQARIEALADLDSGFDLGSGGSLPLRESVYDR